MASPVAEGASIRLGRGVGELVVGALRTAQKRLRAIECLGDSAPNH